MKYYDKKNERLIMYKQKADSEYWDSHWELDNFKERVKAGKNNRLVIKITKKYLPPSAKILEGGCGIGQNVYGLNCCGYDTYGVDFAKNTINIIKKEFPNLKVFNQDVKKTRFY